MFKLQSIILLFYILSSSIAFGANFNAGFQTLGIWDEYAKIRLDLGVWYPVSKAERNLRLGNWLLSVNRYTKPQEGEFPLIILSHASSENRFAHHDLASFLARKGFVVAAPTHSYDNISSMNYLFEARQLTDRAKEINYLIGYMFTDKVFSKIIDKDKISLIGYGSGATVAMLMAGAKLNPNLWYNLAFRPNTKNPYQDMWIEKRLNKLFSDKRLEYSFKNYDIRTIISINPIYSQFFSKKSMHELDIPSLLIASNNKMATKQDYERLQSLFTIRPDLIYFDNASDQMLMAKCSYNKNEIMPKEICIDFDDSDHKLVFSEVSNYIFNFLEKEIINKNFQPEKDKNAEKLKTFEDGENKEITEEKLKK